MELYEKAEAMSQLLATRQVGAFPLFEIIDALPAAVYTTDANGKIELYNKAAAELWGREPDRDDERWCGSWKLYHPDGRPMPHETCPMAEALKSGRPIRGREAIAEKPDGTRINFIPYPTPITDETGRVVGAINMLLDITERNKSEATLARSEARLRDFVETATIGLHWVGPDGIVIWANKAEMEMLGYAADEYIGHHISEFHADRAVIDDILERLGRFEALKNYEAQLRCKDGSTRHVLINSSVYAEQGEFVHTRCFTRDVSSQKLVEQRLVVSARISQILSEASSLDEAFAAVLRSLCDYFDADIAEIWLGDEHLRCSQFHTRLQGTAIERFKAAAMDLALAPGMGLPGLTWQTKKPVWLEDVVGAAPFARAKAAAVIGLESGFGLPIFARGRCRGALVFFTREIVKSDQSLLVMMSSMGHKLGQFIDRIEQQKAKEHLAAVIEASQDAVISVDLDDIIQSWNEGAERLFGYVAEEAIGSPISLLLPKSAVRARSSRIACLKRGKTVAPYETVRKKKSGELVDVSLGYSPIVDSRGNLAAIAAVSRDITKGKIAEKLLKARIQQLQVVSDLGIAALASDDLESVFGHAVKLLATALDVEYAQVLELRPGGDFLLKAGVGWRDGLVGAAMVGGGTDSQAGYTLAIGEPVIVEDLNKEARFSGPPLLHDHRVISGLSTVIGGQNGQPFGVLGAHTKAKRHFTNDDLHFVQSIANILTMAVQKKTYQDTQAMLRRELSHRVKNNMMVVQSIAKMTAKFSDNTEQFVRNFEGRLSALARSHDLLIKGDGTGESLQNVVRLVFGPQATPQRVRLDIEDITLNADAIRAMSMVIYELMTNAAKHGALSGDTGTITLTGKYGQDRGTDVYHFSWRESGGRPVERPCRSGFGSKLLEWTIEEQCRGKLDFDWHCDGLRVDLRLPIATIT